MNVSVKTERFFRTATVCVIVKILLSAWLSHANQYTNTSVNGSHRQDVLKYGVHYSVDTVLQIFNDKKYRNNANVTELLRRFNQAREAAPRTLPLKRDRMPFIIIEGYFTSGKARVAKAVAKTIGAKFLTTPSNCVAFLRKHFLNSTVLKHFYALNKYILSHQIKLIIQTTPVVCDKYWHDHAAFVIARNYREPPPGESDLYAFPEDLLVPDFAFFLNGALNPKIYTPDMVKKHVNNNFTERLREAYHKMRQPSLFEIGPPSLPDSMATEILRYIAEASKKSFPYLRVDVN